MYGFEHNRPCYTNLLQGLKAARGWYKQVLLVFNSEW